MEMVDISCCIYSLLGTVPVTCVPVGFLSTRGDEWCCFHPHFSDKETEVREAEACFLWSQNQQVGAAGIKTQPSALPTLLLTYHTPATDLQELLLHANLLQASYSPFRSGFSVRTQMSVHSAESRRMWWGPDEGEVKGSNTRQRKSGRRHGHRCTRDQMISENPAPDL